ncbi:hypothetical protein HK103_006035 [Boothiomyces macroporosus]|uniref:UspA domain-containing protein n=1 Tax=Boothiomyces macroporosus TaxID=261099 RepID=A0AAD5UIG7_9FUNG|nr:hypothetical protein HK103_006035 [Boothiomyces macroporosus]
MPSYEELVIGADENFTGKRTILLPVDISETAYKAVVWATKHVINPETDNVVLVHCREVLYPLINLLVGNSEYRNGMKAASKEDIAKFEAESKQLSHAVLARCSSALTKLGIHVKGVSIVGDARQTLIEYIQNHKPDLVVMASQGKSALRAAYIGSVSTYLIHHSTSAVAIIPRELLE